tara:strand:+ start:124 stop:414 length:291 start_codon:yes stop_codon:yes gene_type:complete
MDEVSSKLRIRLVINAEHDGPVIDTTKEEVSDMLRSNMEAFLIEDDDGLDITVTTYVESYSYQDNTAAMRERVLAMIEILTPEALAELEDNLKEQE